MMARCIDSSPVHIYATQAEAETKAQAFRDAGWEVIPSDEPERARRGYAAFKGSDEELIRWEMFGKPMIPDLRITTAEQMALAIREETIEPHSCDDPTTLQIGFVWYHVDKSVAVTRRVSLTRIKENEEAGEVIMELWRSLCHDSMT